MTTIRIPDQKQFSSSSSISLPEKLSEYPFVGHGSALNIPQIWTTMIYYSNKISWFHGCIVLWTSLVHRRFVRIILNEQDYHLASHSESQLSIHTPYDICIHNLCYTMAIHLNKAKPYILYCILLLPSVNHLMVWFSAWATLLPSSSQL